MTTSVCFQEKEQESGLTWDWDSKAASATERTKHGEKQEGGVTSWDAAYYKNKRIQKACWDSQAYKLVCQLGVQTNGIPSFCDETFIHQTHAAFTKVGLISELRDTQGQPVRSQTTRSPDPCRPIAFLLSRFSQSGVGALET